MLVALTKQERLHILESLDSPHTQHGIVNSYKRLNNFWKCRIRFGSQLQRGNLGKICHEREERMFKLIIVEQNTWSENGLKSP